MLGIDHDLPIDPHGFEITLKEDPKELYLRGLEAARNAARRGDEPARLTTTVLVGDKPKQERTVVYFVATAEEHVLVLQFQNGGVTEYLLVGLLDGLGTAPPSWRLSSHSLVLSNDPDDVLPEHHSALVLLFIGMAKLHIWYQQDPVPLHLPQSGE